MNLASDYITTLASLSLDTENITVGPDGRSSRNILFIRLKCELIRRETTVEKAITLFPFTKGWGEESDSHTSNTQMTESVR